MTQAVEQPSATWLSTASAQELDSLLDADPYPLFEQLRRHAPVVWVEQMQMWLVTRYADVRAVGRDARFHGASDLAHMTVFGEGNVLSAEGDEHRVQRSFIDPKLRKPRVAAYIDDLVRPTARRLLGRLRDRGGAEIVGDYFEQVSVRSLGDVLGLGAIDNATLQRWFHGLSQALVNKTIAPDGTLVNKAAFAHAELIKAEIRAAVGPIIDRVTREPDDSSIAHWVHDGTDAGQPRDAEQLYPSLFVMLLGAMQEPGHAAATTLMGVLQHQPDLLRDLIATPGLLDAAIEEGLRWIAPIGIFTRVASEPLMVGDQPIGPSEMVFASMGSANRDESVWLDGDRFDARRDRKAHLSFSAGAHTCAGSNFGKAVERIALEELLTTFPDLRLSASTPPRVSGWFFRAPRTLDVQW